MSKQDAVLRYKTAMSVFKKWLDDGVITADDLMTIDTRLAEKYGLSSGSIYRKNELLCTSKRVIYIGND
jgi:hypothetical protein